jgi:hypothetical protein
LSGIGAQADGEQERERGGDEQPDDVEIAQQHEEREARGDDDVGERALPARPRR